MKKRRKEEILGRDEWLPFVCVLLRCSWNLSQRASHFPFFYISLRLCASVCFVFGSWKSFVDDLVIDYCSVRSIARPTDL